MKTITFDNVNSENLFIINRFSRSLLPPLETPTLTIPKRAGAMATETNIGIRQFTIDITILADTTNELNDKVKTIAQWLYQTEDKRLIMSDDPDVYINARLSDTTDLDEIAKIGEGTLQFYAFDPFYYSNTEISLLMNGDEKIYTNNGTYKTFPTIRLMSHGDITNLRITNHANGKHLLITPVTAWILYIANNDKNSIYRDDTGAREFTKLDITSDFFPLEVGENRITISRTPETTQVDVRFLYTERFI